MLTDASREFLRLLIDTPSPSGYEVPNSKNFRDYVAPFADFVTTDALGNVIAAVNPEGSPRIMLAGHIDEIGFIVHYIDDDGYCYFQTIGGHDSAIIVGQHVRIHSKNGPIPGVIGRKPVHGMTPEERGKAVQVHELWIDVGVTGGRAQAAKIGIRIGDAVTYAVGYTPLVDDIAAGRGMDNRIGAWVVAEALRRVKELNPTAAIFAVATVQEEIGLRGARTSAFGINPEIGIAVDVGGASDYPMKNKKQSMKITIGGGPTVLRGANANRKLADRLVDVAEAKAIPYQLNVAAGGTGTDANAMQINQAGMITALVGLPLRYMHTPCEIISLIDADNAAELIAQTCAGISGTDNWTPS